jgi:exoribonuclease II
MNLSLKEFEKKVQLEARIQKKNSKKIEANKKEIQLIIDNANNLDIDNIVEWLESMKEWENDSLKCQTLKAYAQFHSGRVSGMQLAIDLLTTIKKNNLK